MLTKAVNAPTEKDSPDPGLPEPLAYDPDITRLAEEIEKKHPRFPGWRHRNTRGDSNFVSAALPSYPAWQILLAVLVILAAAVLAYYPLLTAPAEQAYPWGADTWGHLYKAEFLYQQIIQGNFFPQFAANWYNGCQPFRYWAPLPYYAIALINTFTHNIFAAGNYYIFACALIGSLGWLVFSRRTGLWMAAGLALVWLIWPNNLQISLNEGNFPRVLTTAILPFLVMSFMLAVERGKTWWLLVAVLIHVTILSHAMMGAVYCSCLMMLALCLWLFGCCSIAGVLRGLLAIIAGIGSSAWWLLPSLKGGLAGMGQAAAAGVQYVSPLMSFSPLARFADRTAMYWGISLLAVIIFTLLLWKKKPGWAKALFCCGLFTLVMTFPFLSWLHQLLPLNELLWPLRFTTFAGLALLLSAFSFKPETWQELTPGRKRLTAGLNIILAALLLFDSYFSMALMMTGESKPDQLVACARELQKLPGWREATMDLSRIQSAPSYLFSSLSNREQVFGWAWQGAATAQNIMLLNTALEREYYPFMFKELVQLGATEVVVKNNLLKNPEDYEMWAHNCGYRLVWNSAELSYWHRDTGPYMLKKHNDCLAIGQYAGIYALQFPSIEIGKSSLIDDYDLKSLQQYPVVIVTGASWYYQTKAEKLMRDYVRAGGKLIVDFSGFPLDVLTRQPKFLGVCTEPIELKGEIMIKTGEKSYKLRPFSSEYETWRAYIPQGMDGGTVSLDYMGNQAFVMGYKNMGAHRVWFLGANPAYHAFLTKDPVIIQLLRELIEVPGDYQAPSVIPFQTYQINDDGYTVTYKSDRPYQAIIPIANLDRWKASLDEKLVNLQTHENLILLNLPAGSHMVKLEISKPPVYFWGKVLSIASLLLIIMALALQIFAGRAHNRKPIAKG